jgi:hypothetical protein
VAEIDRLESGQIFFPRNVWQYTDRIARTARKVLISRAFLRSLLTLLSPAGVLSSPATGSIDRAESPHFAGISYPIQSLRSMRAIVLHTLSLPHLTSYLLACAT